MCGGVGGANAGGSFGVDEGWGGGGVGGWDGMGVWKMGSDERDLWVCGVDFWGGLVVPFGFALMGGLEGVLMRVLMVGGCKAGVVVRTAMLSRRSGRVLWILACCVRCRYVCISFFELWVGDGGISSSMR